MITFIVVSDKRSLEKIVKKIFSSLPKYILKKHCGVLHAHDEKYKTRIKLLTMVSNLEDLSIMTVYLNKKKVHTELQNEKAILYNYVTNILLDRIISKGLIAHDKNIRFIASKRETNKFLNENFQNYIKNKSFKYHKISLKVMIRTPAEEKGLQIVDFMSWALFRRYEYADESYMNIIKNKIIEENPLFP